MSEESTKNAIEKLEKGVFRGWRELNTSILLIAFFAPWVRGCEGEVYTGYGGTAKALIDMLDFNWDGWPYAIGGVFFIVYAVLNLLRAVSGGRPQNQAWLSVPLGGSVVFLILVTYAALWANPLWGLWLAWYGVLFSVIVEWLVPSSERERKQEETPP